MKTHYRKAFDSPYLSSADIVEPTVLTIQRVTLEKDHTKKDRRFLQHSIFRRKGNPSRRETETYDPERFEQQDSARPDRISVS